MEAEDQQSAEAEAADEDSVDKDNQEAEEDPLLFPHCQRTDERKSQTLRLCKRAHTKEGAHWRGNDEVNRFMQMREIVFVGIEKWDRTPKGKVVPEEYVEEGVQVVQEALGHVGTLPTRRELEKLQLWIQGSLILKKGESKEKEQLKQF